MDRHPTPDEVAALVAPLDQRDRKVLGGLVVCMMREPQRVRDREWLSERFVELANVAQHGGDRDSIATDADVAAVAAYARARMTPVLNAAFALFLRTAADLQARGGVPTLAAAASVVRGYLATQSPPAL